MHAAATPRRIRHLFLAAAAVLGLQVAASWGAPAGALSVIATVTVGTGPEVVAVAPTGPNAGSAYVYSPKAGTVSVVGTDSKVAATITLTAEPYPMWFMTTNMAIAPSGPNAGSVYVANNTTSTVSVIGTDNSVVSTIAMPSKTGISGIAVAPTGPNAGSVYVVSQGANTVTVIGTDNKIATTISVGDTPFNVAISPTGPNAGFVYVSNTNDNTVSVIGTDNKVAATVPVGMLPEGLAVAPTGPNAGSVYVANASADPGSVSVIGTNNTVTGTISVGQNPTGVAISPAGTNAGKVYVTNHTDGTVSVIGTNNAVEGTYTVGGNPQGIAVSPTGANAGTVYVANMKDGTVSVLGNPAATAPGAPASFTATPGNGSAALAWQAPASDGGSAITGYAVRYSANQGSTWKTAANCNGTGRSCTVSGLTNGTSYQFEVRATNTVGTGSPASASTTPRTRPSAPSQLRAVHASKGKVKLSWTPGSNGGQTATFDVYVGTKAGKESSSASNPSPIATSNYKVTGLDSGKKYFFIVKARNDAGQSPKSNELSVVVP